MKTRWIVIATLLGAASVGTTATAATTCPINFDDYNALKGIRQSAVFTVAEKTDGATGDVCRGTYRTPDSRMSHPECRMYEQACGYSFSGDPNRTGSSPLFVPTNIFVWNQSNFWYSLLYEDPAYMSGICAPGSLYVNNTCQKAPDPAKLARYLGAQANEWLEIGRTTVPVSSLKPFAMYSVDVKHGPIQLWFQKTDGSVWGWNSLPQGNWLIPTGDVMAVWISNASGSNTYVELWDFAATVQ
jgi:hypothetical protein